MTPFVSMKFFADRHMVWDFLWFGYLPGYARLGIALCQFDASGSYEGWFGCTSGGLPAGTLARSAGTEGTGWIRVGVSAPHRPSSGGIGIYKYAGQWVTAYRISGGLIGFWWESDSSFSTLPVSEAPLSVVSADTGPPYSYGYAPADASRVRILIPGGKEYSASTRPGWPGSGISFWGPIGPVNYNGDAFDTIVITYDAAGHILQEVPLIFLG